MRKWLYYSIVVAVLAVGLVSCSDHDNDMTTPGDGSPTIDPPVNEFVRKDVDPSLYNKKLDAFEYKATHIRKAQEQMEFDTLVLDSIQSYK